MNSFWVDSKITYSNKVWAYSERDLKIKTNIKVSLKTF